MSLTPHHFHSHSEHQQFFADHLESKGSEIADACDSMLKTLDRFEARLPQPASSAR